MNLYLARPILRCQLPATQWAHRCIVRPVLELVMTPHIHKRHKPLTIQTLIPIARDHKYSLFIKSINQSIIHSFISN